MKKRKIAAIILALALAGCQPTAPEAPSEPVSEASPAESAPASEAESAPEPEEPPVPEPPADTEWELAAPADVGMDAELLASMHEALEEVEINAVVTVKDGYIVDEYYKEDYDASSVFRLASCSKSFTGALVGVAIEQGYITGVDAKFADYCEVLRESDDDAKKEITLFHLLTHSSGIEWYEWNGGNSFQELNKAENWVEHILAQPMVAGPGERFDYTTGGSHLLAAALQEATGMSVLDFGREHLFTPLGMDSVEWREDPQGVIDGGNGISMTARDAAKFGQIYLDGGRWKGRQILPEAWVTDSLAVQFSRDGNAGSYGYQWWVRPFGGYEAYYAMGYAGQYIFVVPELQLVTVVASSLPDDTYGPWAYFEDYIVAACAEAEA